MDRLVAPVEHLTFEVENLIKMQIGAKDLPFPGMDKSGKNATFWVDIRRWMLSNLSLVTYANPRLSL